MVPPSAEGQAKKPPKASSPASLDVWDRRSPLTLTVTYRGGSEGWYEVRARGRTYRRPGWVAIHDLMRDIYDGKVGAVIGSAKPRRPRRRPQQ